MSGAAVTLASRFRECLKAITGEDPPEHFDPSNEGLWDEIQQWCVTHARPDWSTGIAIFEAAESMVREAVGNANIGPTGEMP